MVKFVAFLHLRDGWFRDLPKNGRLSWIIVRRIPDFLADDVVDQNFVSAISGTLPIIA